MNSILVLSGNGPVSRHLGVSELFLEDSVSGDGHLPDASPHYRIHHGAALCSISYWVLQSGSSIGRIIFHNCHHRAASIINVLKVITSRRSIITMIVLLLGRKQELVVRLSTRTHASIWHPPSKLLHFLWIVKPSGALLVCWELAHMR